MIGGHSCGCNVPVAKHVQQLSLVVTFFSTFIIYRTHTHTCTCTRFWRLSTRTQEETRASHACAIWGQTVQKSRTSIVSDIFFVECGVTCQNFFGRLQHQKETKNFFLANPSGMIRTSRYGVGKKINVNSKLWTMFCGGIWSTNRAQQMRAAVDGVRTWSMLHAMTVHATSRAYAHV
jgi:hypothetical protein